MVMEALGGLRQCREQFWHFEAATLALSLEFLGPFSCSNFSKIEVQDLVPCPIVEKVRVDLIKKRKIELRYFQEQMSQGSYS